MNSTSYFYNHSSQWRYETVTAQELLSPLADKILLQRPPD